MRKDEIILISRLLLARWTVLFALVLGYLVLEMPTRQFNIALIRLAQVLSQLYLKLVLISTARHFSNADGCTAKNLKRNSQWWRFSSTFYKQIGALSAAFSSMIEELLHPLRGLSWRYLA